MPIITLTTDFGLQDYYVATLKGALLQKSNQLNIIDISHNINHYDIVQAAFVLKNAFNHFPSNTIHLVCVNNYVSAEPSIIVAKHWGHYFVVPDNGLMALLFEELPKEMYRIYLQHDSTSPMRTAYAKIVQYLVEERPLDVLAEHVNHIIQRISLQPVIGTSQIRGTVIYIDHYENAVVNITKDLFYRIRQDRDFALYFK
ncbi:MAG: SAM-dependent chlorinase/fluorinase, partial [Saprospiraceae bacterium]